MVFSQEYRVNVCNTIPRPEGAASKKSFRYISPFVRFNLVYKVSLHVPIDQDHKLCPRTLGACQLIQ